MPSCGKNNWKYWVRDVHHPRWGGVGAESRCNSAWTTAICVGACAKAVFEKINIWIAQRSHKPWRQRSREVTKLFQHEFSILPLRPSQQLWVEGVDWGRFLRYIILLNQFNFICNSNVHKWTPNVLFDRDARHTCDTNFYECHVDQKAIASSDSHLS